MNSNYDIVVGLEIHVQLATKSKCFAPEANDFGALPNTHISVINLAHPGTLPKVNRKAIELAVKMGLACDSKITQRNVFARKNYFYPDLPKGYQLTQDHNPICVGGGLFIKRKDYSKHFFRLHHIHLEEDAGKSIHTDTTDTLLDFNRAGTPLIEIVTEPDFRSTEDVVAFLQEIRRMVRWLGISDGNMEEGSLRCDANVSVKLKDVEKLGTRVEIKNLNSFKFVQKAIEYEANRQIQLIEKGEAIQQETRLYDSNQNKTFGMRTKENLHDYRYFPEPDLNPVVIDDVWLSQISSQMPVLPQVVEQQWITKYQLPVYDVQVLSESIELAEYFEATCQFTTHIKAVANWMMKEVRSYLNDKKIEIQQFPIKPKTMAEIINLVAENQISQTVASQQIFPLLIENPATSPLTIAQENQWILATESFDLSDIIADILRQNVAKVKEYQNGKKGLLGMFMGELMKATKGKANPKDLNEALSKALSEFQG
jgi:aspartyl-tRNA(Asn)/glutamyl-tRNA(Gln) amidotransferase subunit B